MSVSKPLMKQQRTNKTPTTLVRCDSVKLSSSEGEEERSRRTGSPQISSTASSTMTSEKHPKGHKVRELADVWKTMDSQDFLHLTDTLTLNDVWVQPLTVEPAKGAFATVTFKQIVAGPHLKYRDAKCRISLDDLSKMLYLNDCLQYSMQNVDQPLYEDWLNEKSANCVKMKGMEEGSNRAKLCHFIINEDRDFTFYPAYLHGHWGMFFRKICYHSYSEKEDGKTKLINPSMMKCSATKGSFEYILEARIFPLPENWFDAITELLPETAPMDGTA